MMQVAKLNVSSDRRLIRRALLDEEVTSLIQAAEKGPVIRDMTGPERAMLYRLAVETGLRAGELASLTPASFHMADLDAATVKVTAAYSKHRRDDVLPLRRDVAEAVAAFTAGKPADARLFAVPPRTAEMIQTDLAAAREAWIKDAETKQEREGRRATAFLADTDGSGRVVDFHALRHTFITRLARSGVVPAVAKSLARHSTIVLTMDHYTHTLIGDERAALDRLPAIRLAERTHVDRRATGTSDAHAAPHGPPANELDADDSPQKKLRPEPHSALCLQNRDGHHLPGRLQNKVAARSDMPCAICALPQVPDICAWSFRSQIGLADGAPT